MNLGALFLGQILGPKPQALVALGQGQPCSGQGVEEFKNEIILISKL